LRSLIRVAFLNVFHNAVKFSPDHSTLRILYSLREEDLGGRFFWMAFQTLLLFGRGRSSALWGHNAASFDNRIALVNCQIG
jgi:hypothetical protein